jgi:hypothetical protein
MRLSQRSSKTAPSQANRSRSWSAWLRHLSARLSGQTTRAGKTRRKPARRSSATRPGVEPLETRLTPTGTWQAVAASLPNSDSVTTMLLLPNGDVMVQGGGGFGNASAENWYELKPDASGDYANGSWSKLETSNVGRLFYGSAVLPDGRVFIVGGEVATDKNETNSAEIYDPSTGHWKVAASYPESNFGDGPVEVLFDGKVLAGSQFSNKTYIYDPSTDTWSTNKPTTKNGGNFGEEGWVKLPDGSILDYKINKTAQTGERFVVGPLQADDQGTWVNAGNVPVNLSSNGGNSGMGAELGPGVLLHNGQVFWIGANNHTAFYDPSTGNWTQGKDIPNDASGNAVGGFDAPAAVEPSGKVLLAASPFTVDSSGNFGTPTTIYEYDPSADSYATVPDDNGPDLSQAAFNDRMLVLPNGQILFSNYGQSLYVYKPDTAADAAASPSIDNIVANGDGSFHLSGFQLNGLGEGASYGDDQQMASNFPLVRLSHTVTILGIPITIVNYAPTTNWSSEVATGPYLVSTDFTLSQGLAPGFYTLQAVANGVASSPVLAVFGSGNETVTLGKITIFETPVYFIQMNEGTFFYDPTAFQGIDILAGGGSNTVNIQDTASFPPVTVGGGGSDTVNIGNSGSVQDVLGEVDIENPPNFTTVNVDDSADPNPQNVSIETFTALDGSNFGSIDSLAPGTINYEYDDTNRVTIQTSSVDGNVVNVFGTGVTTNLVAHALATVDVGGGNVRGINGTLNIENPESTTTLNVDDTFDGMARAAALFTLGVNPADFQGDSDNWGTIRGLAPADINYEYADTSMLTVTTDTIAGNVVDVETTNDYTRIVSEADATVNVGEAVDGVREINGLLDIENPPHLTTINVDDSADGRARNATLSTLGVNVSDSEGDGDTYGQIIGLSPVPIRYEYFDTASLTIITGSAIGNVVNVQATGATTNIVSSANATVNVGNSTDGVQDIFGDLNIENPLHFTDINVDDSVDRNFKSPILSTLGVNPADSESNQDLWGQISGLARANINYEYADITNLTVSTGTGGAAVNVQATGLFVSTRLLGNSGNTTVTVGDHGDVRNIDGDLTIENQPSTTTVIVDDSADPNFQTATLSTTTIVNDFDGDSDTFGQITGLTLGNINYEHFDTSTVTVSTGTGGATVNVQATQVPTSVIGNASNTTVNVGNSTDGVQDITATLNIENVPARSIVNVDDSADPFFQTVTLSTLGSNPADFQGDSDTWGQIIGLARANINYEYRDTSSLTVSTGVGGATVDLLATGDFLPTRLLGNSSNTTVNVGDHGSLQNITGDVTIENQPSTTTVNVDDSADTNSPTATLSTTTIANDADEDSDTFGQITGLSFGAIRYEHFDTSLVTLATGPGGATVNVQATGVPTDILGGYGPVTVHVGNGTDGVQDIQGDLAISDLAEAATVSVDDSANTGSRTATIDTATRLNHEGFFEGFIDVTNLAPARISTDFFEMTSPLTVTGGSGGNTFNVQGTGHQTLVLNAGAGGDMVNVGSAANMLDPIQGSVTVNGAGGNTMLNVNDQGTSSAQFYDVAATQITRAPYNPPNPPGSPTQTLNYFHISQVNVHGGSAANLWGANSTQAGTTTALYSGGGSINHGNEFIVENPSDNLDDIQGPLAVHGGGIFDFVTANDGLEKVGHTYTLTTGMLQRDGMANITYDGLGVFILGTANSNGSSGLSPNTVKVQSLGTLFAAVLVGKNDTVTVGQNGSMSNILSDLRIQGLVGQAPKQITLDDSADTTARTITLGSDPSFGYLVNGMANGSQGKGRIGVQTDLATPVSIRTGPGQNLVQVNDFTNATVVSLIGNAQGTNTLQGPAIANTWVVTGPNAGTLDGALTFTNVQNLVGGALTDTFLFNNGKSVSGTIDGGAGINTLDYSHYTAGVTVNLTTGAATGVGGGVTHIQNVTGTPANDSITGSGTANILRGNGGTDTLSDGGAGNATFILAPTQSTATVVTGSGVNDTLDGANLANTWTLRGAGAGNVNGIAFTGITSLVGNSNTDAFIFKPGGSVSGTVDGGAGSNRLDYSNYGSAITVNLLSNAAPGTGGFAHIQALIGSGAAGDTLVGNNGNNLWTLTGPGAGNILGLHFSAIANLTGGPGNDTFHFNSGAGVTGMIDGGGGSNRLDYSSYGSAITVNLQTMTAPGTGGFTQFQSLTGSGSAGDQLVGPNTTSTWTITGANAGIVNGTLTFTAIANLTGGTGVDTFQIGTAGHLSGNLNGGGAPANSGDWLDYKGNAGFVAVNLATGAATGVAGTVSKIQNVFGGNHGNNLTGSAQGNILIGGNGNDTITGGTGRSLLIGGQGADGVTGGSGDDILIGGYTTYDQSHNEAALMSLLAEWQSADDYATRINDLKHGGGLNGTNVLVLGSTVKDDAKANSLTGGPAPSPSDLDWFFQGLHDTLHNVESGEQIN